MDQQSADVRRAYDQDPEQEWLRLTSGAQNQLEYLITCHALGRHLPTLERPRRILDAGGGPGRYTMLLAEWGYTATLLDLSPAHLDLARLRLTQASSAARVNVEAIVEGSITDLSQFPDDHFDAVLCLGGPVSHLPDPAQRTRAVEELARVATGDAPLFISVFNRFALYRAMVQWNMPVDDVRRYWRDGLRTTLGAQALTTFSFTPVAFVELLRSCELLVERMYGTNGLGAHLQEENLQALMADPVRWEPWKEVLLATCDDPSIIGVSRHLLGVARKHVHGVAP